MGLVAREVRVQPEEQVPRGLRGALVALERLVQREVLAQPGQRAELEAQARRALLGA